MFARCFCRGRFLLNPWLNAVVQPCRRFEADGDLFRNGDGFAGFGVSALPGGTNDGPEGAESGNDQSLPFDDGCFDALDDGVDRRLRSGERDRALLGVMPDEIGFFVHDLSSFSCVRFKKRTEN